MIALAAFGYGLGFGVILAIGLVRPHHIPRRSPPGAVLLAAVAWPLIVPWTCVEQWLERRRVRRLIARMARREEGERERRGDSGPVGRPGSGK